MELLVEQRKYKLKSFISIKHSFDGKLENIHAHTVEICCVVKTGGNEIINYKEVETVINGCIQKYENKYLNAFEKLKNDATIENLGEVLCYEIDEELHKIGFDMDRFEIGETPLRVYVITDELRD